MCPRLLDSLFMTLGVFVLVASGQQPGSPGPGPQTGGSGSAQKPGLPGGPGQPSKEKKGDGPSSDSKKADPADLLVQAALANDPDVKLAQAKIQLADAELAKARQAVVLKVLTLNATIQDLKQQTAVHVANQTETQALHKSGAAPMSQLLAATSKVQQAQSELAKAELELKLMTGGMPKEAGMNQGSWTVPNTTPNTAGMPFNNWIIQPFAGSPYQNYGTTGFVLVDAGQGKQATKGPIPERIRAALDKTVKLAPKGEQVTFAKALEVFKNEAGLDVPVREVAKVSPITSEGEELPVGAWFELFTDNTPDSRLYVREYGLLITAKSNAPSDAITVGDLWKRSPTLKKDGDPKASTTAEPLKR